MRNEEYDFTSAVGTTPTVGTTAVGTSSTVGGSTVIKRLKYINSLMHLEREREREREMDKGGCPRWERKRERERGGRDILLFPPQEFKLNVCFWSWVEWVLLKRIDMSYE